MTLPRLHSTARENFWTPVLLLVSLPPHFHPLSAVLNADGGSALQHKCELPVLQTRPVSALHASHCRTFAQGWVPQLSLTSSPFKLLLCLQVPTPMLPSLGRLPGLAFSIQTSNRAIILLYLSVCLFPLQDCELPKGKDNDFSTLFSLLIALHSQ